MSIFILKIIAYISMFLDHIKYALPITSNFVTMYFGRIAFPLFAFLISEGYAHTKNLNKYFQRLLNFALISQIPFMLFKSIFGDYLTLNILFTLILGLIAINVYDKLENKFLAIIIGTCLAILAAICKTDYKWYGVFTVMIFYIFRNKKILLTISFIALNLIYEYSLYLWNFSYLISEHVIYMLIFMNVPLIFIWLYNGKLGKKMNYIFYWFYPVHMIILYLLNILFVH